MQKTAFYKEGAKNNLKLSIFNNIGTLLGLLRLSNSIKSNINSNLQSQMNDLVLLSKIVGSFVNPSAYSRKNNGERMGNY